MDTYLITCPASRDPLDFFDEVYRLAQEEGVYAHRRCGQTYITGEATRCVAVRLRA